jgi:hypothetical protein
MSLAIEMSQEICPVCNRWPRVFPSGLIAPQTFCANYEFHGFTPGYRGTIAAFEIGMRELADKLRGFKQ